MSAEARYFRVGLFMFVGIGLIGSCAVILGGQGLFQTPVPFETYFDESVQGLEKGSPVKFRGVSIGTDRPSSSGGSASGRSARSGSSGIATTSTSRIS
jgi:hypothetical protein